MTAYATPPCRLAGYRVIRITHRRWSETPRPEVVRLLRALLSP